MDHLNYCEQQTGLFVKRLLEASWHDLDSHLYERTLAIKDPKKRVHQLNAMQDVRFKADQAAASLASQNQLNFLRYRDNLPLRHHDASAVSALSHITRLEDSLEIHDAISSVQQTQQHPLWQINKRMALLRGGIISNEHDNPLAPASLCLAYQTTVLALAVDARTRLTLYEVFGKAFRQQTNAFYQTINKYLAQSGVLPNLLQTISPARTSRPPPIEPQATRNLVDNEKRLDHILQDLKASVQWPSAITRTFAAPSILPVEIYTQACREVQSGWASAGATTSEKQHPRATLEHVYQRLIAQADRRSTGLNRGLLLLAELVTRLFEWLVQAEHIAPRVQQLLNMLHAPYIGLAVTDRSFFLRADHPGRLLLDAICFHGSLWQDGQQNDQFMLPRLRHTVERLASTPLVNRLLLEQSWIELDGFVRDKQSHAALAERRSVQTGKGLCALAGARAEADLIVRKSMQSQAVCDDIAKRLQNPCVEFLTFTLLRQGYGQHWDQACKLMDGIAMSVRGRLASDRITKFQRGQQRLIKATRSSLSSLGYESMLVQDLLVNLRSAQDLALQMLATDSENRSTAPATDTIIQDRPLDYLNRGQWYRITSPAYPEGLTLKLAWRSGSYFLFVDIQGKEIEALDAADAAKAWEAGTLAPAKLPCEHATELFLKEFDVLEYPAQNNQAPG
jgi:hypothetical protein